LQYFQQVLEVEPRNADVREGLEQIGKEESVEDGGQRTDG